VKDVFVCHEKEFGRAIEKTSEVADAHGSSFLSALIAFHGATPYHTFLTVMLIHTSPTHTHCAPPRNNSQTGAGTPHHNHIIGRLRQRESLGRE